MGKMPTNKVLSLVKKIHLIQSDPAFSKMPTLIGAIIGHWES